jgi:hypothetical protein
MNAFDSPMTSPTTDSKALHDLQVLLTRRLEVIANKDLRESDPSAQLAQLQQASESIGKWHLCHRAKISARLNHFLDQASYQKALDYVAAEQT